MLRSILPMVYMFMPTIDTLDQETRKLEELREQYLKVAYDKTMGRKRRSRLKKRIKGEYGFYQGLSRWSF